MNERLNSIPEGNDFRTRFNGLTNPDRVNNAFTQTSQASDGWFNRGFERDTRQGAEDELRRSARGSEELAAELLEIVGQQGDQLAQVAYRRIHVRVEEAQEIFDWLKQNLSRPRVENRAMRRQYCQQT